MTSKRLISAAQIEILINQWAQQLTQEELIEALEEMALRARLALEERKEDQTS